MPMNTSTIKRFCASLAVVLSFGAIVALAQGPGPGGAPPPGFGGPPPPTQGFESNIQLPAELQGFAAFYRWLVNAKARDRRCRRRHSHVHVEMLANFT